MTSRATALSAIFLGPAACAADQIVSYMLVYPAAASGSNAALHLVTLLGGVVAAFGLYLSYRALRRNTPEVEVDRFLGLAGIGINAFFLVVILVGFGLPKVLLNATD